MENLAGQTLKNYYLRDLVGIGKMGVVYRAYQSILERDVAIKIIRPEYANHPDFIRRFDGEVQRIIHLEHPSIVPLYDYWREPNYAYLVMQWLYGGNLISIIDKIPPSLPTIAKLVNQVFDALIIAHQNGIFHGNVKPSNILLDEEKNAYLTDFGLTQTIHIEDLIHSQVSSPAYLAPEQIRKQNITAQVDIYSLGVVIFELLAGHHPFAPTDSTTLYLKQLEVPLPSLCKIRPDLPRQLDTVLQQATAKTPQERFTTVLAFAEAFRHAIGLSSINTRSVRNPYKGLRAFREGDANDFFGREILIDQLVEKLPLQQETQFLAIVGPSGSGKSSLVKAGLIPKIRRATWAGHWYLVEMLPGKDPFQELASALLQIAPTPLLKQQWDDEIGLLKTIEQILPDDETELVLIIDQFEELFTLVEDEKSRVHFLNSIVKAVTTPYSQVHVIITMRADFYDRPLLYPQFSQLIRHHTEVITPMSVDELKTAIVEPAKSVGLQFEIGLVDALIADLNEQPGALPLLQHTLSELFEHRHGNMLTLSAYHRIGRLLGSLAKRAEEIYHTLTTYEQWATRQIFLRLVTPGDGTEDTRRRVERAELLSIGVDSKILEKILDAFGKYRLLTFDYELTMRTPTVEIAHEALIRVWERLRSWLNESRDDLRLHRRLTFASLEWLNSAKDQSFLATGVRLSQFEHWAATSEIVLSQQESAYLKASIEERQHQEVQEAKRQARESVLLRRSQSRLWALVLLMFTAVMGAFVLTGWALSERETARKNESQAATAAAIALSSEAQSRSLALAASARQALSDNDPDLAIVLALEANRLPQPPPQSQQVLVEAVYSTGTRSRRLFPATNVNITSLAFGSDGRTLLIGYEDRFLRLWDMDTGQIIRTLGEHDSIIYSLVYSLGGRTAIAGTGTGKLVIWDVSLGIRHLEIIAHTDAVTAIAYHPTQSLVLSGSSTGEIALWDYNTGQRLALFEGHTNTITELIFSPDGSRFISGSMDDTARIWDISSKVTLSTLSNYQGDITTVDFSATGEIVLTGGMDGRVLIWNANTGEQLQTLTGHVDIVNDAAFSEDGRIVISGSNDRSLILWDLSTGEMLRQLTGHSDSVWEVSFLRSDERSALSLSADGSMRLWDIESGAQLRRLTGHGAEVTGLAYSPDGRKAISGGLDRAIILWDLTTGEVLQTFGGYTDWVLAVAFSADGNTVLASTLDGTMVLWDVLTGQPVQRFEQNTREINSLAFSPDGNTVLSGAADGRLKLWDIETGEVIRNFIGHPVQITSVAFSPDGKHAISGAIDGTIRLWYVSTGTLLRTFTGHTDDVLSVVYSPDGSMILSGSADKTLRLWDTSSGQEVRRFIGHLDAVTSVAFSPTGFTVLSASLDRSVRLWDVSTADEIARFDGHADGVTGVAFSPDGSTALSASRDNTLRLWRTFRSLNEIIAWTYDNRYVRELTCGEREKYLVPPLCKDQTTQPFPTALVPVIPIEN